MTVPASPKTCPTCGRDKKKWFYRKFDGTGCSPDSSDPWHSAASAEAPKCICDGSWPVVRAVYVHAGKEIRCPIHASAEPQGAPNIELALTASHLELQQECRSLRQKLEQAERERDAAVMFLRAKCSEEEWKRLELRASESTTANAEKS